MIIRKNLNHPILDLAVKNNVTFCDTYYIVTSIILETPLITEDEKAEKGCR